MTTDTPMPPTKGRHVSSEPGSLVRELIGRISRLEVVVAAVIAAALVVLVLIEPDVLEAPFENGRTLLFTFGGTALAAIGFVVMLWLRVPPVARLVVLLVPFAVVNWWLISPYFIDDVVDEEFSTSISAQATGDASAPTTSEAPAGDESTPDSDASEPESGEASDATEDEPLVEEPTPTEPVLLGAGQFVGLAGHEGTGDAGIFQNPDGSLVLRFENFDIENGPDLKVYLVPGADQTSLPDGSIGLGELKGNIGDQNYELPPGTELAPGAYTALVWCEAFSVEFVGATIVV